MEKILIIAWLIILTLMVVLNWPGFGKLSTSPIHGAYQPKTDLTARPPKNELSEDERKLYKYIFDNFNVSVIDVGNGRKLVNMPTGIKQREKTQTKLNNVTISQFETVLEYLENEEMLSTIKYDLKSEYDRFLSKNNSNE